MFDECYLFNLSSQQEDSRKAWFEYLETKFKEKTPEIEEIPWDFYRESALGLGGLEMALSLFYNSIFNVPLID